MRARLLAISLIALAIAWPEMSAGYSYAGYRWGGTYPTVGIDTTRMYITAWRYAATDAMNNWNNTGSRWRAVNYVPSANTISLYYDAGTSVLAYTKVYRTNILWGDVYRATITVNNAKYFNPPYTWGYDLRSVLRHELGHFLVLNHEDRFYTLMNSTIRYAEVKNITSDEWSAIRNIYGVR